MLLSDYVIKFLADNGIDNVFVLYGAANGPLIDSFTRIDTTRYVAVMHEQGGGFAAEGYAKIKGVPGAAVVTSGPGAQNIITAVANCFYDSVPCIFLSGQINSNFLRPDPSIRQVGFQECDIVALVSSITKYAKMITDPKSIRYEMEKALHMCQERRPGPVFLDLPINLQKAEIDPESLVGFDSDAEPEVFDLVRVDAQIDSLLDDLKKAKRPVLMVGGGVRIADAVDETRELARSAGIPAFPTWNALDVVASDFEMYGGRIGTYGGAGRNFGIQNADLLLAVGSRIPGRITGGNVMTFARGAKKYVVDVDPALLQRRLQQVPFDVNIYCDAKIFCTRLLKKLAERKAAGDVPDFSGWVEKVMEWKKRYDPVAEAYRRAPKHEVEGTVYTHPYTFTRNLSRQLDDDAVVCGDLGGVSVVIAHALETKMNQRYFSSNGNAPMGFSFAAAMGAWIAAPDKQCVALIGDGGMNINIQELQTLINYGIKLKTFILNNHIYGITKAYQLTNFQGRTEACGPQGYNPPDFRKVAAAYGIRTLAIDNDDQIESTVAEALAYDGPVVCDVNMHDFHVYQPRIFGWETPIEDMYPYIPRDEFRANMFIEPHHTWEKPVYPDVEAESME